MKRLAINLEKYFQHNTVKGLIFRTLQINHKKMKIRAYDNLQKKIYQSIASEYKWKYSITLSDRQMQINSIWHTISWPLKWPK